MSIQSIFEDIQETLDQLSSLNHIQRTELKAMNDYTKDFDKQHTVLRNKLNKNNLTIQKLTDSNIIIEQKLHYIDIYKKNKLNKEIKSVNYNYLELFLEKS